MIYCCIW